MNVQVVLLTCYAKKDNGDILKNTIIDKLQKSFILMLEAMSFDNKQVSISNTYVSYSVR